MKKSFIPIIIVILVIIAGAAVFLIPPVRNTIFGTKLEYKFKPGDTASYKTNTNMEFHLPLPAIVQLAASKNNEISTALNMDSSIKREVTQVKDGKATIASTIRMEKLLLSLNGKDITPEIPAGFEKKIVFTTTPNGNIAAADEGTAAADEETEGFSTAYVFFQGWISLPDKPVRPGNEWTGETDTKIGGKSFSFRMKGPVKYKFVGATLYKGKKCAEISFEGNYETESLLRAKGLDIDMKASAKLSGKAYFDPEQGRLMLLTRDINVNISKKIPLTSSELSGNAKYQIRTEIEE